MKEFFFSSTNIIYLSSIIQGIKERKKKIKGIGNKWRVMFMNLLSDKNILIPF